DISFLHDQVDESDLFAANDEDAFAESRFGVVGLKHNLILGERSYLRTIVSGSVSGNDFVSDRYTNQGTAEEEVRRVVEANNTEYRYSVSSFVNQKFNAKFNARAGILLEQFNYDLATRNREYTPDWETLYEFDDNSLLAQAYVQTQYKLNKKLTLNTGLHLQGLTLNDNWVLEPRAALNYKANEKNTFSVGYGLHSQYAPLPILLQQQEVSPGVFEATNTSLKPTRNQHFVLGYDARLAPDWRAKVEAYYQRLDNVPVDPFASSYSLLNEGAGFTFSENKEGLVNEGTGSNIGLELTIEKFFSKGYYALITASLYDSKYTGSDGVERNTAFNNQYVLNVLAGREFKFGKEQRYAFTLDTKLTTAGGRNYTPVDLEASRVAGREILQDGLAFSEKFDPYFRWDVKVGMKINSRKRKLSHHFYFDVQNVTGNENIFTRRYNRLTNQINDVYQLGFFPDFMYRIQF
ncbi:MAG: TonB-dependent receptor, partial [Bacteroidota bacterium]